MTSGTLTAAGKANILLEAGTNELEILVFRIGDRRFGVNVAKVREVLELGEITVTSRDHEAAEGVVRIRDFVVALVNLEKHLFPDESSEDSNKGNLLLLLEFNNEMIAFRVHSVDRIFRHSWKDVVPMPQLPGVTAPVTSVVRLEGQLVLMLDFETIGASFGMAGVRPQRSDSSEADRTSVDPKDFPIVYAEDSLMIREMIKDELLEAGYSNIQGFTDGDFAWQYLSDLAEQSSGDDILKKVACLISDIEMPRMDGLTLTRKIREHASLKNLPVILFSSITSSSNENKALQVGANAQISKPKYQDLTNILEKVLREEKALEKVIG